MNISIEDQELITSLEELIKNLREGKLTSEIKEDIYKLLKPEPIDQETLNCLFLGWYLRRELRDLGKL